MEAPDKWLYEYALVRYVPRIDREEFVNIGLVMLNKRCRWLRGKIWIDEKRLRCFYKGGDLDGLRNQCRLFELTDVPAKDLPAEEKYRWLTAVKSAVIQVSPSHPGIVWFENHDTDANRDCSEIMEREFERLFCQLVK